MIGCVNMLEKIDTEIVAEGEVSIEESIIKTSEQERELKIIVKGGKVYSFFKRLFDIFCSALAILILFPFLLIIGILVKITSRGPMLYVSTRIGKNGKAFRFYKFRSMKKDAEKQLVDLLSQNETQAITFKMKDDPRITKFGKFIR